MAFLGDEVALSNNKLRYVPEEECGVEAIGFLHSTSSFQLQPQIFIKRFLLLRKERTRKVGTAQKRWALYNRSRNCEGYAMLATDVTWLDRDEETSR